MVISSEKSKLHDIHFGTDGWRALIAEEFTYKNLHLFLNGLAEYLLENYGTQKPLIIGYDARFLADKFANFAAGVINSFSIAVKLVDHPVPTPVIAHAARELDSCGALTFTASHNPPEYMGIKYIPEYAGPASIDITNKILEKIDKAATKNDYSGRVNQFKLTNVETINPKAAYFKQVKSIVNFDAIIKANKAKPCKLVYDPLYACGLGYTNILLKEAGFDLVTIHDHYDSSFGGSLPDPSEKRLTELKAQVLALKANLGAANDGDADRFAFFDEEGNFYPANKSLSIILKYLVEYRGFKGALARTVATTHLLDDIAHKFNLKTYETAVGFKWLCEIMRREAVVLSAEESGGMSVLGHIPEKDGILAIMLMAEVLAVTGKKLSTLWDEVQDFVGKRYYYSKLDLHLEASAKAPFMAKFENLTEIAGFRIIRLDKTEGIKVYLEDGSWLLARPSGTEAMARVYFEGNNLENLSKIKSSIEGLI